MAYTEFYKKGKQIEMDFANLFNGSDVVFANPWQDKNEHWDLSIDGSKFDVKGMKRINRSDNQINDTYHYVEAQNVQGDPGWLYGQADYFAFETISYFLIVEKFSLQDFIEWKVPDSVTTTKEKYRWYTRKKWGRDDKITLVPVLDMIFLDAEILDKQK